MNYLLISCCLLALVLFARLRPTWRNVGPSLLDSYVLGLLLFALGSVAVWVEGLPHSESVLWIGLVAAISGILGASFWSYFLRDRIGELQFFYSAQQLRPTAGDQFAISAGFVISALVSVGFLVAIFSNEHIRSLLLAALFDGQGTLNEARITISNGGEGYFAPGYVKQFRDALVPILCAAAVICHGAYRHRALFYVCLVLALISIFASGQRLVVLQLLLCLGSVFLMDFWAPLRPRFVPLKISVPMLAAMIALVGIMTSMLGRLDFELWPDIRKIELREELRKIAEAREQDAPRISAGKPLQSASPSDLPAQAFSEKLKQQREAAEEITKQLIEMQESGKSRPGLSGSLVESGIPRPIAIAIALAHRAVIAVPRENTVSYVFWSSRSPAMGAGWWRDFSGIRFGTQTQISNELAMVNQGGKLGNSPLGLATDVYYNWGWLGVLLFPALYALAFLLIDIVLVSSNSPLLLAAKIFVFFAVPLMYTPFLFVLYGGAVVIAMICYVALVRRGALASFGIRA